MNRSGVRGRRERPLRRRSAHRPSPMSRTRARRRRPPARERRHEPIRPRPPDARSSRCRGHADADRDVRLAGSPLSPGLEIRIETFIICGLILTGSVISGSTLILRGSGGHAFRIPGTVPNPVQFQVSNSPSASRRTGGWTSGGDAQSHVHCQVPGGSGDVDELLPRPSGRRGRWLLRGLGRLRSRGFPWTIAPEPLPLPAVAATAVFDWVTAPSSPGLSIRTLTLRFADRSAPRQATTPQPERSGTASAISDSCRSIAGGAPCRRRAGSEATRTPPRRRRRRSRRRRPHRRPQYRRRRERAAPHHRRRPTPTVRMLQRRARRRGCRQSRPPRARRASRSLHQLHIWRISRFLIREFQRYIRRLCYCRCRSLWRRSTAASWIRNGPRNRSVTSGNHVGETVENCRAESTNRDKSPLVRGARSVAMPGRRTRSTISCRPGRSA